jgi:tyrosyl-tRNA synthetase
MGGSDQWGNITSGTEFIRRNIQGKAYAVTTPLLTKADGSKFGKSEEGNIWLDANMTTPYKFYQFWVNASDQDINKFMRYFTLKTKEEVEAAEIEFADNPNAIKRMLAEELTIRVHSEEAFNSVQKVSNILFNKKANKESLMALAQIDLQIVSEEIPSFNISKDSLSNGLNIVDLLAEETQILNSKSDARRAIKGNAISVNKDKINSHETNINQDILLHGKYFMVENGKKNKFMVIAE